MTGVPPIKLESTRNASQTWPTNHNNMAKANNSTPAATVNCKTTDHVEMLQRFPEINYINNDDTRQHTIDALVELAPEYFWEIPAATTYNHHNPYACNKHGLWIHTKMVFTAYQRLVDSFVSMDRITKEEADLGRAACLLHDIFKNGRDDEDWREKGALRDHDLLAAEAIEEETPLDERVSVAIAEHMGPWYDGPEPSNDLSLLVHMADMIASSKNITPGVARPAETINDFYPSIPGASL